MGDYGSYGGPGGSPYGGGGGYGAPSYGSGGYATPGGYASQYASYGAPAGYGAAPQYGGHGAPAGYGGSEMYQTTGYGGGPAYGSMAPQSYAPQGQGGDEPGVEGTSYKVPRGAKYIGAKEEVGANGKTVVIDRYAVPQRHVQQVEKLIEETKQVTVMENKVVPETRTIQVPMQRMVPQQHTIMVPRVKMVPVREMVPQVVTKMVPENFMQAKNITTERTIQVPSQRNVKVNWVRPGQVVHESQQILEYERPRLIPGRFRQVIATQPKAMGMQWGGMYPISDEQAGYLQTQGSMSRQYENNGAYGGARGEYRGEDFDGPQDGGYAGGYGGADYGMGGDAAAQHYNSQPNAGSSAPRTQGQP